MKYYGLQNKEIINRGKLKMIWQDESNFPIVSIRCHRLSASGLVEGRALLS